MRAFCCKCQKDLECDVVGGDVIYPHRADLYDKKFVQCPICNNYTGLYPGEYPTLPTEHVRQCRYAAHRALDKIWQDRKAKKAFYKYMSKIYNREFHWGLVRDDHEADEALEYTLDYLKKGGEE